MVTGASPYTVSLSPDLLAICGVPPCAAMGNASHLPTPVSPASGIYLGGASLPPGAVEITGIEVRAHNIPLKAPFPIASDVSKVDQADNVLVIMRSAQGFIGLGEAAPFAGIARDSQELLLDELQKVREHLIGQRLDLASLNALGADHLKYPASRTALEIAFLDLLGKQQGKPLAALFQSIDAWPTWETDITIPLVDAHQAFNLAMQYRQNGFGRIKVKVGDDPKEALERLQAVNEAYQEGRLELLIDANAGYTADQAIAFVQMMSGLRCHPKIFEQPVARDDFQGMHRVREAAHASGMLVFADESVFTMRDLYAITKSPTVDGINIKITKHGGIQRSLEIANAARIRGLRVMIGGMVEGKITMTASLHAALLIGEIAWFDLDTPLLLDEQTILGGIEYEGAQLSFPHALGVGVVLAESEERVQRSRVRSAQ